ncbi:LysR family transcriptional regulator [Shewanella avicenniae]|uniref:HTH-type transcriptional regulator MetR n=1 Tax=Shewanella avicenniae TaxID=2814294 RepID=A0ABX7QXB6_9GAMM|nr:LysR family transcriptional regulator [Shewanella avicenniae]QSX35535.1 LysR family transcriptional regulator [Shewanella avicenniae]
MIELRHLRTVLALKQTGSLAAAAAKCFVTQSALSHQLKELETRIDAKVFVRKSKPLSFTAEGLTLVSLAEDILPKVAATEQSLKSTTNQAHAPLRIGIDCHSCYRWLMPVMAQFKQQFPDERLDLLSRYSFDALDALEQDELDLVLTSDPVNNPALHFEHLSEFEVKLVVGKDTELAQQAYVSPEQLAGETIISYPVPLSRLDLVQYFLAPAGVTPGPQKTCDLTNMLLQRIACGEGVASLPSWSLTEAQGLSLTSVRLGENGLYRPMYAAVRRDTQAEQNPLIQRVMQLIASATSSAVTAD